MFKTWNFNRNYLKLVGITFLFFNCLVLQSQKKVANFIVNDSNGVTLDLYKDYLDKGKIVVIDLFFVDCPPCNTIAPFLKQSYIKWGNGNQLVEFISLSPYDNNLAINLFKENHQLTHPCSGTEGGGDLALEQFTNGFLGEFDGYPLLILIKPDGTVQYDIHSNNGDEAKIDLLDLYIAQTLKENIQSFEISLFPNPAIENGHIHIKVPQEKIFNLSILNMAGKLLWSRKDISSKESFIALSTQELGIQNGFHILILESEEEKIIKKFVIH